MNEVAHIFKEAGIKDVRIAEPMSRHTTWKVGGPVDFFVYPQSKAELESAMNIVRQKGLEWLAIGRGSNLLIRDKGLRGVVIKIGRGLDKITVTGNKIVAGGGCSSIRLSKMAARHGLTGLEFAEGIPGTVGGAVFMNAGAHGSESAQVLQSAEILLESGEWATLSREELGFRYRTSILQKERRGIVTQAVFELTKGNQEEITQRMKHYKEHRRKTQPLQHPCAGSVFRNPPGDHAGRLIEASGLKGYQIGDAMVSTQHANFIINRGQAKAEDVLNLIHHIRSTVEERFGVQLVPEVRVVGEG